jgi:hypothetical protein
VARILSGVSLRCVLWLQGMGAGFTAGIVQQLGVTPTAALVARFGGNLTGGEG